jgi:putative ABC transport system permease protein
VNALVRDIRYAARGLLRTPLFTLGIVATLGLGIGVNAAMFGVVDTLFLRPPAGVHGADRVVRLYVRRTDPFFGTNTQGIGVYPAFVDIRDGHDFADVSAVTTRDMSLGRGAGAMSVNVGAVSWDYFTTVGVGPERGRLFVADDDHPGATRTVVLTDAFWRAHYGANPGIVGRSIPVGAGPAVVVGVAARGFRGIDLTPLDMFMPIGAVAAEVASPEALTSRHWWWMDAVARLRPGQRPEGAVALATLLYRRGAEDKADSTATVLTGPIQEARGPEASSDAKVSAWIGFVALAVLLIVCANVANLLLARGVSRRRELAVRAGLGAGRGGLMRLLLAESLVLAAAGGAAALALAAWTGALARGFLVPDLPAGTPVIDLRMLAFTALAVVATALLIGVVPAVQASRTDLTEALKSGGRGATQRGGRTRAALLAVQVALTLVLLVGAGLFVRSLRNVEHINLGFDPSRVLEARVDMKAAGLSLTEADATYLRALDHVRRLPGVAGAAAMQSPYQWAQAITIRAQGVDSMRRPTTGGPYINAVTPGYFGTLGTALVSGREFSDGDVAGSPRVAVVNADMAKGLWPHGSAIGKCLYLGSDTTKACTEIVGVVGDVASNGVTQGEWWNYYVPFAQAQLANPYGAHLNGMVVRSRTTAADIAGAVRREMQSAGNLPYAQVQSLADRIAPAYRSWRLGATAFTAFGALALLIAAMGIFAVISYSVSRRTQEIGVRMALGAEAAQVARMVLGQGLRAALVGVVLGAGGAWALGRGIRALLYHVSPADPLVLGSTALVLVAVAALAAWLPARRATKVNPVEALRAE